MNFRQPDSFLALQFVNGETVTMTEHALNQSKFVCGNKLCEFVFRNAFAICLIRTQSAKTEERKTRFFTFNRIKSLVFWSARLRFLLLNAIDKIFLTCNNFYSEMGVFAHMKGDLKMNIHAVVEDRVCSLSVAGRIDTLTAPELEQAFADHSAECDKMIFDLSEVDYISSAGLRVIVAAHREMEKKNGLILRGLSKNVESIIKLTGFNRIMHIEP